MIGKTIDEDLSNYMCDFTHSRIKGGVLTLPYKDEIYEGEDIKPILNKRISKLRTNEDFKKYYVKLHNAYNEPATTEADKLILDELYNNLTSTQDKINEKKIEKKFLNKWIESTRQSKMDKILNLPETDDENIFTSKDTTDLIDVVKKLSDVNSAWYAPVGFGKSFEDFMAGEFGNLRGEYLDKAKELRNKLFDLLNIDETKLMVKDLNDLVKDNYFVIDQAILKKSHNKENNEITDEIKDFLELKYKGKTKETSGTTLKKITKKYIKKYDKWLNNEYENDLNVLKQTKKDLKKVIKQNKRNNIEPSENLLTELEDVDKKLKTIRRRKRDYFDNYVNTTGMEYTDNKYHGKYGASTPIWAKIDDGSNKYLKTVKKWNEPIITTDIKNISKAMDLGPPKNFPKSVVNKTGNKALFLNNDSLVSYDIKKDSNVEFKKKQITNPKTLPKYPSQQQKYYQSQLRELDDDNNEYFIESLYPSGEITINKNPQIIKIIPPHKLDIVRKKELTLDEVIEKFNEDLKGTKKRKRKNK